MRAPAETSSSRRHPNARQGNEAFCPPSHQPQLKGARPHVAVTATLDSPAPERVRRRRSWQTADSAELGLPRPAEASSQSWSPPLPPHGLAFPPPRSSCSKAAGPSAAPAPLFQLLRAPRTGSLAWFCYSLPFPLLNQWQSPFLFQRLERDRTVVNNSI